MWRLRRLALKLYAFLRPARAEQELTREVAAHLGVLEDEFRQRGMTSETARLAARRSFGGVEQAKERSREERSFLWLEDARRDLKFAVRGLRRRPGFAITAIVTIGLGLGFAIGLFAVVDAVLLQPLPFAHQDELVVMWEKDDSHNNPHIEVSLPNFEDWRAQAKSFADMAAIGSTTWGEVEVQQDPPIRLTISAVSASFFDVIGAQTLLGRTFLPEEDKAEAERVMVLSHATWQQYFGSNPDVIGSTVPVGAARELYTVIGVMPPAFQFPPGAEVWTPVGRQLAEIFRENGMDEGAQRGLGVLYAIGRLAPGHSLDRARAELDVIVPGLWESHLMRGGTRRAVVTLLPDYIFGNRKVALFSLLGGVMLLLVIACTNITGLMIVRSQARRRDVAIQCALGIERGRLFRAHLVEMLLITGAAAAGGVGLAHLMLPILVALGPPDLPRLDQAAVNGSSVALAAALMLVCAFAMTAVAFPRTANRLALLAWLRDGAPGATAGRTRAGTRNVLIVTQVAIALVLVVGAGLLTQSYLNLAKVDLGYRPEHVLTVNVTPRDGAYPTPEQRRIAYRELLGRIRRVPGVAAAGAAFLLPFEHGVVGVDGGVVLEGEPLMGSERRERPPIAVQAVLPEYFRAMGIRLVAGRPFTDRDTADAPGAVMVSESLARYLWPANEAVGRRLIAVGAEVPSGDGPDWQTVVGVVADARYREIERARFDLYVPSQQVSMRAEHVVARTDGDPTTLAAAIRDEIQQADPNFVVESMSTLRGIVDGVMRPWAFNMTMATLFAGLAIGLVAIGLFGTVAYSVTQRTREIGVRRALGAQASDVLRVVWGQAVVLTVLGIGIGLVVVTLVSETMRPLLFGVAPRAAATLAVLAALLLLVCGSASLLAAYRATRIDPMVALRPE